MFCASLSIQVSSSTGRAPVSKTGGYGFDSCLTCLKIDDAVLSGGVLTIKQGAFSG